jgi:CheY-like chemotaxis protein
MRTERIRAAQIHGPIVLAKSEVSSLIAETEKLAASGISVFEVTGSDEAISYLESRNDIRLLIADLNVRGCFDGLELARFVENRWPDIGVVILGLPVQLIVDAARVTFIPTPYTHSVLVKRIRARLNFTIFSN